MLERKERLCGVYETIFKLLATYPHFANTDKVAIPTSVPTRIFRPCYKRSTNVMPSTVDFTKLYDIYDGHSTCRSLLTVITCAHHYLVSGTSEVLLACCWSVVAFLPTLIFTLALDSEVTFFLFSKGTQLFCLLFFHLSLLQFCCVNTNEAYKIELHYYYYYYYYYYFIILF